MKHIILSKAWEYSTEPFPAYRANLVYGQNKRDREFLPVKDVTPVVKYIVWMWGKGTGGQEFFYEGTDKSLAEAVKALKNEEENEKFVVKEERVFLDTTSPVLPEGRFRVIKTKEKGTILVVPGNDDTNRCLLFVGCSGGFRGGESVLKDGTTGTILKTCSAGNACESSTEAIVLLDIGQSIAFHTFGRRTNEVYLYTWTGTGVEQKHFSKEEWDNRNAVVAPAVTEDAEVL